MNKRVFIAIGMLALSGCATDYQKMTAFTMTGGYGATLIEGDVYRVSFSANGFSTRETAQTYWLYQCSELALSKGYSGFEILSNIGLVMTVSPEQFFAEDPARVKTHGGGVIFVPTYSDNSNKPFIQADIKLLKGDIATAPPKVFDAAKLKAVLQPYVEGKKCEMGNVCPHVHKYLFPDGAL